MEAALATFTVWFIIGLIVFILIIVAIIGTWFEAREMRKELEQVNAYLATLNDNLIIGFQNNDRQSRNFWEPAALVPAFLHCAVAPAVLFLPCGTCALPCAVFGANCVRNEGDSWAAFPSFWSIESIENIESVEKS